MRSILVLAVTASLCAALGASETQAQQRGLFGFLDSGRQHHEPPRPSQSLPYAQTTPAAATPAAPARAPARAEDSRRQAGFFDFLRQPERPRAEDIAPDRELITGALGPAEAGQPTKELVDYATPEHTGTVVIDTNDKALYLVLEGGKALRYGIGVGREGFEWSGREYVTRKREWPDWRPPASMRERQPYLPSFFAGGPENPMGARAIYLGQSLYRIHGTNEAHTIGQAVSSGCIRMLNEDIEDLYARVPVGAMVVVL